MHSAKECFFDYDYIVQNQKFSKLWKLKFARYLRQIHKIEGCDMTLTSSEKLKLNF